MSLINRSYTQLNTKQSRILLCSLYIIFVCVYGFLVSKATAITYIGNDEDLYISMARSFFYDRNISRHYEYMGYTCILYSMLISLAYFFYSPTTLLFVMRLIGVFAMSSTLFPVYLLSRNLLKNKNHCDAVSILMAILAVCLPEMSYTSMMLQETLMYPLFFWMLYFSYKDLSGNNGLSRGVNCFFAVLLSFLCYITKTFAIIFPASYCFAIFFVFAGRFSNLSIVDRKAELLKFVKKIIFVIGEYLLLLVIWKLFLYVLNGCQFAATHYDSQISMLFPITVQEILDIFRGIFFYLFYFLLYIGIIPLICVFSNYKRMDNSDQAWVVFLVSSCFATILEIVVTIYLTENAEYEYVNRIHTRYLFYFFIPLIILYFKYLRIRINMINSLILVSFVSGVLILYNNLSEFSIDSLLFCYLESLQGGYIGFNEAFKVFTLILVTVIVNLVLKRKFQIIRASYIVCLICVMILVVPYSWNLLISNSDIEKLRNEGFVNIADYIDENDITNVYYIKSSYSDEYADTFKNYLKCDYHLIVIEDDFGIYELDSIPEDALVVISETFPYSFTGLDEVKELDSYFLNIYTLENPNETIVIDTSDYVIRLLEISDCMNGNRTDAGTELYSYGYSYGQYNSLIAGTYDVKIEGENLLGLECRVYSTQNNTDFVIANYIATENTITFSFTLDEDVTDFELYVYNNSEENAFIVTEEMYFAN